MFQLDAFPSHNIEFLITDKHDTGNVKNSVKVQKC